LRCGNPAKMAFVKVVKNQAYFKRFQVKYRRRRDCKTDYQARRRLVTQDKNKYQTEKYRFVVRITNKDVICQIFTSDMKSDKCVASAYSHELTRYGIANGLTNYAAAYCTGLLLARRVDEKFKLAYEGNTEVDGGNYHVEPNDTRAPFKALLDVGLAHTTVGARIFGALKGACDGGLDVPHHKRGKTPRCFPGCSYDAESKKYNFDAEVHRNYIFGGHVADYMTQLEENDVTKYQKHFARYIASGVKADDMEDLYTQAHALIRADPRKARPDTDRGYFHKREAALAKDAKFNRIARPTRRCVQSRKDRIKLKLKAMGKPSLPLFVSYERKN
jgi:large subunit ribosomal protein L5e